MPSHRHHASTASGGIRYMAVYRLSDRVMVASFTTAPLHDDTTFVAKVLEANAHAMHPRLTVTDPQRGARQFRRGTGGLPGASGGAPSSLSRVSPESRSRLTWARKSD